MVMTAFVLFYFFDIFWKFASELPSKSRSMPLLRQKFQYLLKDFCLLPKKSVSNAGIFGGFGVENDQFHLNLQYTFKDLKVYVFLGELYSGAHL